MGRHSNPAQPGPGNHKASLRLPPASHSHLGARLLGNYCPCCRCCLPLLLLLCFSQACSKWHNFRFCFVAEITEIINKYARPSGHQSPTPFPFKSYATWRIFGQCSQLIFMLHGVQFCLLFLSFTLSLSTAWQSGSIIIINYHFVGIASAVTQQQQQQQH